MRERKRDREREREREREIKGEHCLKEPTRSRAAGTALTQAVGVTLPSPPRECWLSRLATTTAAAAAAAAATQTHQTSRRIRNPPSPPTSHQTIKHLQRQVMVARPGFTVCEPDNFPYQILFQRHSQMCITFAGKKKHIPPFCLSLSHSYTYTHTHTNLLFELFLSLANPSHLRMRVDDGGHTVIIDVDRATCHALHADDALVLGLVCQHGPGHHIADSEDTVRGHKSKALGSPGLVTR